MREISDKNVEEINYFFSENHVVMIMWENMVETDTSQEITYYDACSLHTG